MSPTLIYAAVIVLAMTFGQIASLFIQKAREDAEETRRLSKTKSRAGLIFIDTIEVVVELIWHLTFTWGVIKLFIHWSLI